MRHVTRSFIGLVIAGIISAPAPVAAQEEWQARIQEYLDRVSQPAVEDGFTASGPELTGALAAGTEEGMPLELEPGSQYTLIGVCDADCSDIDLELYDLAGHEIDSDLEYDDVPVVSVTPDNKGSYRVVVGMVSCSAEPCYYGVRVLSRPAPEPSEHQQVVRRQLEAFDAELAKQGYQRTHGFRIGTLGQAESAEFMVRLKAGTTYGIAGFCDRDCADLDLSVLADESEPVVQDVQADDHPALDLEVTGTGVFRIRVTMAACSNSPCVYGVALHGRPTGN